MRTIGKFDNAFEYAEKAIENQPTIPHKYVLASSYNIMGLLWLEGDKIQPQKAISYFRKASKTLKEFNVGKEIKTHNHEEEINAFFGRIHNNLGLAYIGINNTLALVNLKKSLRYKKLTGDLIGRSITSANICLVYLRQNKKSNYYYWKHKALKLMSKYHLTFQNAYLFREIGDTLCQKKNIIVGLKYLRQAEKMYREIGGQFGLKLTIEMINRHQKTNFA